MGSPTTGERVRRMFSFRSDRSITGRVPEETLGTTARTKGGLGTKETLRMGPSCSSLTSRDALQPGRPGEQSVSMSSLRGLSAQEKASRGRFPR